MDVEWDEDDDNISGAGRKTENALPSMATSPYGTQNELKGRAIGLDGEVVCRWSDANTPGLIPAIDEAWQYAPAWSVVSIKSKPAIVEGSKSFMV